jgi:hypothetical protein
MDTRPLSRPVEILLVEDNPGDVRLTRSTSPAPCSSTASTSSSGRRSRAATSWINSRSTTRQPSS